MLEILSAGVVWLQAMGVHPPPLITDVERLGELWLPPEDAIAHQAVQQYLKGLTSQDIAANQQGIWIQSQEQLLASHDGEVPLSAASLTKVVTSLAALQTWSPDHQFITEIRATGPIQNGVLQGDLVIQGSGDPLFVWEEGFSLGNALNQLGIRQVQGDLLISPAFVMNYETEAAIAGPLLKESMDSSSWSDEATNQFPALPPGTPKPKLVIQGEVKPIATLPSQSTLLVSHQSLPLHEIIKQMNIYSNNEIAEILAQLMGGALRISELAATTAEVPLSDIQLLNGSGLGQENRLTPRAVSGLFQALQRQVAPHNLTIADLFPMAGRDRGTIEDRRLPSGAVVKTGTLWDVSALAGAIPTRTHGTVWFTIINRGTDLEQLRQQQDRLLQTLTRQWGTTQTLPEFRTTLRQDYLGNASRNQLALLGQSPAQQPLNTQQSQHIKPQQQQQSTP